MSENKKSLGILGSGQLSRMLAEAAEGLGLEVSVLGSSEKDPAFSAQRRFFTEVESLLSERPDLLIFENEFIHYEPLRSKSDLHFVPSVSLMEKLSDKIFQKQVLGDLEILTSEYRVFAEGSSIKEFVKEAAALGTTPVYKWAKFGYDGHGTLITNTGTRLEEIESFINRGIEKGAKVFAEKKISFVQEVAMLGFHSVNGDFVHFPLVVSHQENGICKRVFGPAIKLGVPDQIQNLAAEWMKKFCQELGFFGAFAFEFFLDEKQNLFVNEIAPRVHNTGHFSQFSATRSQFQLHIEACLGNSLKPVGTDSFFGMYNLLGPESLDGTLITKQKAHIDFDFGSDSSLYWYAKSEIRSRRKMGHVNFRADSREELLKRESEIQARESLFWQSLVQSE